MGMGLQMRRCNAATVDVLRASDGFGAYVAPEDYDELPPGELIDLDKAWHAIHFLLTGAPGEAELPAGALVSGEEVGEGFGLGPARLLSHADVGAFGEFLSTKPDDFVEQTLDFSAMEAARIYPAIWGRKDAEDTEYVAMYFRTLKTFVQAAAAAKDAIVLVIL